MTPPSLAITLHARRVGASWMAHCPSHHDENASMSIQEKNGKVLVHCHAGCPQNDVIAALRAQGVWQSKPQFRRSRRILETYDYTDEHGELLYQVVRFEPKGFCQRRPTDRGWLWSKSSRQVLYHLPEILEAPIVFVAEGEKDVETLRKHGFVATTNAGGANAPWLSEYTEALRGREVILIPDNDRAGRQRVLNIARNLLGNAARIVILELKRVKDITEWFEAGHSELELIAEMDVGVGHDA